MNIENKSKLYFNNTAFLLPFHHKIHNKNLLLDRIPDIKDGVTSYFAKEENMLVEEV